MGTNRLAAAGSAYLRSAAHQPVEWYPWGDEAFAAARAADQPILLDIGAVWCHWCHVMDGESYEDPALAEFLNQNFVCIKVDRDERPDIDARYQRAVQAVSRQGGWPLTGFLTPDAELFFGGTYFPPHPAHGHPAFRTVLSRILEVWRGERAALHTQARAVGEVLRSVRDDAAPGSLSDLALDDAAHRILAVADRRHGGFGSAPKFPHPAAVGFLLQRCCDNPEPTALAVVRETLDAMANGGFRDLLGGGFHRYSVDERWIVPHFEKLSSDNAELLRVYADAGVLLGEPDWLHTARDTVRWLREVLADPQGGFGASQDADVGLDDDGSYFTWTAAELRAALPSGSAQLVEAHFGLGSDGRMPHAPERNVLFRALPVERLAREAGRAARDMEALLAEARERLLAARTRRPAPVVDRTRYTNWNALLAGALLRAGPMLGDPWAEAAGLAALRRIREHSPSPETVAHSVDGVDGLLDDPVQCAAAALDACEATGEVEWLIWAERLLDRVWRDHWDAERGGLWDTAKQRGGPGLLGTALKPIQDSPNASANGVAGQTLARLFEQTREPRWRERHQALVTAFGARADELGLFASSYLVAADWLLRPASHVLITGAADDPRAQELHRAALAAYLPRRVITRLLPGADPTRLPEPLRALAPAAARARGYVCAGTRCLAPSDDLAHWLASLRSLGAGMVAAGPGGG